MTEITASIRKLLASIFFASFSLPSPILMLMSGEPPIPTSEANADIIVTMGPQTPTPARAFSPISAIFPMYIRSTTLYSTFTNWASMEGMAILMTSRFMSSLPRSFSIFISSRLLYHSYVFPLNNARQVKPCLTFISCFGQKVNIFYP